MKLLGISKFNDGIALIVDEVKPLAYSEHLTIKKRLLIGDNEDGLCDVLYWEPFSGGPKAFGGAKLTWQMKDGTIKETDGWWWSGDAYAAEELLGKVIFSVPIATLDELTKHYVFFGRRMYSDAYGQLFVDYVTQHFKGPELLDYWTLEKAIKDAKADANAATTPEERWDLVMQYYRKVSA